MEYLGIEYISHYVLVRRDSLVVTRIDSICPRGRDPRRQSGHRVALAFVAKLSFLVTVAAKSTKLLDHEANG